MSAMNSAEDLSKKVGYLNEDFFNFAKQADLSGDLLSQYKEYMNSASNSTDDFSASLKSTVTSIGIMLAINLAIQAATKIWDTLNVTVAETQEKIDNLSSSIESLNQEYDSLNSRDYDSLTQSEKDRLDYLDKRIEREEKLLELEKAKKNQELVDDGFTDWFDESNYGTQLTQDIMGASGWEAILENVIGYGGFTKFSDLIKIFKGDADVSRGVTSSFLSAISTANKYKNTLEEYQSLQNILIESDVNTKDYADASIGIETLKPVLEEYESKLDDHEASLAGIILSYQNTIDDLDAIINDPTSTQSTIDNAEKLKGTYQWILNVITSIYNVISNILNLPPLTIGELDKKLNNVSEKDLEKNFSSEEIIWLNTHITEDDADATIEDLRKMLDQAQKEADNNKVEIETITIDNFKTASESISSLTVAFKELSDNGYLSIDAISSIKDAVGDSISNWDEYEKKLMSVKAGTSEYNQIMNDLTYSILKNKLGVDGLATADKEYVARILKENGISNSDEVAQGMIDKANAEKFRETQTIKFDKLKNADSFSFISSMMQAAEQAGITKDAYAQLLVQETMLNSNTWNVSQKLQALSQISQYATGATFNLELLNKVMKNDWSKGETKISKRQFAEDNDIDVIKTGRILSNGKDNWKYGYNGVEYETLDTKEHLKETQYEKYLNWIIQELLLQFFLLYIKPHRKEENT